LCSILALVGVSVNADVKMDEKSQVKFGGMLGKMMNFFGGKAAKEGLVSSISLKGDRRLTLSDTAGQIVDLNEEKVYDFDLKKKTYKVTTFEEMRRQIEEARQKAEKEAAKSKEKGQEGPEMEVEIDMKETGQTKAIGGHNCQQVVMTIKTHEKGKTIEQSGGLLMTVDMWMAPDVKAGQEMAAFERRYFEKLHGSADASMLQAMALYPGLDKAFAQMKNQSAKVEGTPMQSVITVEAVPTKEQLAQQQKQQQEEESGGGGLIGGFAKRLGRKKNDDQQSGGDAAAKKNAIMTMNQEILKLSTTVAAEDIALPAGLKLKD